MIQRWEPVLSPIFPSQIPFWIWLHGLPLHYWHQKIIYKLGHELGTLEDYCISKTSAKICISIDGLKPLIKNPLIEFASGEELKVQLVYEGLEKQWSICNRLSHLAKHCPQGPKDVPKQPPLEFYTENPHMDPSRNHSSSSHRSFVEGVPHRSSALNQQKLESIAMVGFLVRDYLQHRLEVTL